MAPIVTNPVHGASGLILLGYDPNPTHCLIGYTFHKQVNNRLREEIQHALRFKAQKR